MIMLIILGACFVVQKVLISYSTSPRILLFLEDLALSKTAILEGHVWQLLTFQFMHANWMHLLGNCVAIFVFGRDVEEALGRKNFLTLYFSSGIIGGLFQALAGVFLGGSFAGPVVGASAGVSR